MARLNRLSPRPSPRNTALRAQEVVLQSRKLKSHALSIESVVVYLIAFSLALMAVVSRQTLRTLV